MRLLALSGQPEAALSHFAALRETLRRELHVEAQDETLMLAGQIAGTAAAPVAPVRMPGGIALPSAEAEGGVRSPASIALHFEQAGRSLDAARWCLRAARSAARRSAWAETAGFARRALKALSRLPESDTLDELALAALLSGAQAHVARGGYYDARAQQWYARADRLMGRPNADRRRTLGALRGRWLLASSSASHREAMLIAERMIAIAQAGGLEWMRGVACYLAGNSGLWLGEFERAFAQLTEAVDLLRRTGPDACEPLAHEQDFEATATGYLAWAHWHLGRTGVALDLVRNALHRAQESAHAPTWMHVAVSFGSIAIGAALPEEVSEIAGRIVERAERHGLAMWADIGRLQRHWARACVGDDRHLEDAAAALDRLRASYPGGAAGFHAIFAESCLFLDDHDRMREALARLRDAVHRTQAAAFAAPMHRLEGELAGREGRLRDAQRALRRAVELAVAQRSPALEARARTAALALRS